MEISYLDDGHGNLVSWIFKAVGLAYANTQMIKCSCKKLEN